MLRSVFSHAKRSSSYRQSITLDIDGAPVDVAIRHNERAKRYTLRLSQKTGEPVLTIPRLGTHKEATSFAEQNKGWLKERLARRPQTVPFEAGNMIPLRGKNTLLVATGKSRGSVRLSFEDEQPVLHVPGEQEHFERRLTDWLKKQARADIETSCQHHAENLGLYYRAISIRDQRTRWGSCSSEGRLNFSWRLIFAPPEILDYVAAHEVAHLQEMNHQPQFWALVKKTCPEMEKHRAWLRHYGAQLHMFGV